MTSHVHTWTERDGALPWMRFCACGAEGHMVAGEVYELGRQAVPAKRGRR